MIGPSWIAFLSVSQSDWPLGKFQATTQTLEIVAWKFPEEFLLGSFRHFTASANLVATESRLIRSSCLSWCYRLTPTHWTVVSDVKPKQRQRWHLFCFYISALVTPSPSPKVQTPPGVPPLPSVFPLLPAGSHSEAGAVLRGPGGAGGFKSGLRLRPLRPETRPATRRGPQGQWPHRRLSGESACPTLFHSLQLSSPTFFS